MIISISNLVTKSGQARLYICVMFYELPRRQQWNYYHCYTVGL